MSETVGIVINGDPCEVPTGMNIIRLLDHLGLAGNRVAIERNLDILSQAHWDETRVSAGDRYEIVHLVGGG